MEKNIKDYLKHYLGGEVFFEERVYWFIRFDQLNGLVTLDRNGAAGYVETHCSRVKPILRPLSDMTNEEADHFAWLCMNSRHHLDEETKIDQDEIDTELVKWDNGTMLDDNVEIYIGIACRCFEGALMINRDGSISLVDDEDKRNGLIDDIAFKVIWLIKQGFDLFGLITANLAIDKTEHR